MWHDRRHDVSTNQSMTHVKTWIRGPTRARNRHNRSHNTCQLQVGQESSPQGSVGPLVGRPAYGPHQLNLPRGASSLDVKVGSKRHTCRWSSPWPWLPPINIRGGGANRDTHHTSQHTLTFSLELGVLHPRCFRQPGGVED